MEGSRRDLPKAGIFVVLGLPPLSSPSQFSSSLSRTRDCGPDWVEALRHVSEKFGSEIGRGVCHITRVMVYLYVALFTTLGVCQGKGRFLLMLMSKRSLCVRPDWHQLFSRREGSANLKRMLALEAPTCLPRVFSLSWSERGKPTLSKRVTSCVTLGKRVMLCTGN